MSPAHFGVVVVGAFVAASVGEKPAERTEVDRRIETFPVHRTDHFSIHYGTDPDLARAIGTRMEATYGEVTRFCKHRGINPREPAAPMKVVLFDRIDDFERFRGRIGTEFEEAVGFYSPTAGTSAFFNLSHHPDVRRITEAIRPLEAKLQDESSSKEPGDRKDLKERIDRLKAARDGLIEGFHHVVIQHETVHATLDAIGVCGHGCCADWLAEGLASVFEVDQPKVAEGVLQPNEYRLGDIREVLAANGEAQNVAPDSSAERQPRMPIPLRELLDDFEASHRDKADLYAESWALVYYLLHAKPDSFNEYLRAVAECSASAEHSMASPSFEATFGPVTWRWEKDWIEFVMQVPLNNRKRAILAPPADSR